MNKFLNFLENHLGKFSMVIADNKVLQSIKDAFILSIPFTVVGSFSNLIKMQLDYLMKKPSFGQIATLKVISNVLGSVGNTAMGLMGIVIVLASAYYLANSYKATNSKINPIMSALLALVAYFVTVPTQIIDIKSKVTLAGYAPQYFNYEGMFTALIIGLVTSALYNKLVKTKFTIKLPDSVPPGILNSFLAIIPIIIILTVFAFLKEAILVAGYGSMQELIKHFIVTPLSNVGTGLPAIIIVILLMQLLWFFGLHGFSIMWGVISSLWLPIFMKHIDLYAKTNSFDAIKEVAPNTISNIYAMIGGSGCTLALIVALLIFAPKKSSERSIAKLGLVPGLFNINEPVIFGLPIVLNPLMFIPFVFIPVINAIISYFAVSTGLVTPLVVLNAGIEPVFLNTWVLGAFKLSPILLMLALFVLDICLYAPFVKVMLKQNSLVEGEK
ncbi:PTS sugar transporter subunit IIC [Clostridium oceanicum]|uniref:Permease IIC component n=1 Tax=Clostridium oceanicum TaxID=1543 RepID=A0ABN1JQG2_9CLOT